MNDTTQTTITEQAAAQAASSELKLPDRALIILPTRNAVLFPGVVAPLGLGRPQSIAGAQAAARADKPIGVLLQTDPSMDTPGPEHLHRVGTVAEILRYVTTPDGSHHLVARGTRRFRVTEFLTGYPYLVALVDEIGEAEVYSTEIAARTLAVERAGIWLFIDQRQALRCYQLFERSKGEHSEGTVLSARPGVGFAVRFTGVDPATKARLMALVAARPQERYRASSA